MGPLIEAEILTSQLPMYLLNLAQFLGTNTLPSGVSASPKQSRNVSIYLRNFQKNLVNGALIEAEILTCPLPHVFSPPGPVLIVGTSLMYLPQLRSVFCQDLPSDLEMLLMCLRSLYTRIWCMWS